MTDKQEKTSLVALTQEQIAWLREAIAGAMEGAGADGAEGQFRLLETILEALSKGKERDPFVVELRLGSLEAKVSKLDRLIYKLYQKEKSTPALS